MLYVLFMALAIAYNLKKFKKERDSFIASIEEANTPGHREMILGHHFYIFIFEGFLALIVAHLVSEKSMQIGILGLGVVYLGLFFVGLSLYQYFVRYLERQTELRLFDSLKAYLIKELRVNFAMIMMPILVYSIINWAFQDSVYEEWGNLWFVGLLFNIVFVSVLTIVCSVILMLRLIPNREITEPEYLEIINRRLSDIGQPKIRVRWIETDIKNAFVVGLKLLRFSNQTMFIGRSLRNTLTLEEFDAVIAHELSHVANRHIHRRVIDLIKNVLSILMGMILLMLLVFGFSFMYWGEDSYLYTNATTAWCVCLCLGWMVFNYALVFDTIRSHEYEADAFAVIELKASLGALRSALQKLTTSDELPAYLKARTKQKKQKTWLGKFFSTHPELEERMSSLEHKIQRGLPFNYYVSTPQKIKAWLGHALNWKVSLPLTASFVFAVAWVFVSVKSGQRDIAFIQSHSPNEIMKNVKLVERMNSKPLLIGQTLMYYVVMKKDEKLIDFFLENGANKGKTLMYVSQLKDSEIFSRYYARFEAHLSEDEYFLILRKTAQVNFTEGYRLLVNGKQFEKLDPSYKDDVTRLNRSNRAPASVKK